MKDINTAQHVCPLLLVYFVYFILLLWLDTYGVRLIFFSLFSSFLVLFVASSSPIRFLDNVVRRCLQTMYKCLRNIRQKKYVPGQAIVVNMT